VRDLRYEVRIMEIPPALQSKNKKQLLAEYFRLVKQFIKKISHHIFWNTRYHAQ
jgi:hypothetical protein